MRRIMINASLCDGCKNCTVACMQAHRDTPGTVYDLDLTDIHNESRNHIEKMPDGSYRPIFCRHCDLPECVMSCMSGALSKDPETGIVSYDEKKCGSCFMCVMNCPYGVLKADTATHTKVVKCDFCMKDDAKPNCVKSCPKKAIYVEKTTDEAAKLFGINSNAVGYVVSDDEPDAKLYSVFKNMKNKKTTAVAADIFESYGTIRFINMFPLVIKAMQTGGTLVVDEFDASIHPMALMSIINVFHNDDVNIHHAQLIFNTHNPIFLNSNLFRRDEIKFVERDDDTHDSVLYALSDFGTTGDKGVRKHEDYMSKYFISQYGAIKDIDFTPIFEEILCDEKEG